MLSVHTIRGSGGKLLRAEVVPGYDPKHENRNDWHTMAAAEEVAAALGPKYIATDAGDHVSPRYDVVPLPQLGDPVSYAFNGDCYPCGYITRVSGAGFRRIEVQDGFAKRIFWRRRLSGSWINEGTWSLVAGHHSKRNPEF